MENLRYLKPQWSEVTILTLAMISSLLEEKSWQIESCVDNSSIAIGFGVEHGVAAVRVIAGKLLPFPGANVTTFSPSLLWVCGHLLEPLVICSISLSLESLSDPSIAFLFAAAFCIPWSNLLYILCLKCQQITMTPYTLHAYCTTQITAYIESRKRIMI